MKLLLLVLAVGLVCQQSFGQSEMDNDHMDSPTAEQSAMLHKDHGDEHGHDHGDEHGDEHGDDHDHDHDDDHDHDHDDDHDHDHDDDHDHDHDDDHDHDHDDDHDHDHDHGHGDRFIPHCDCVIKGGINCSDEKPLDDALEVLMGLGSTCLNECQTQSVCMNAFWVLHAYHEICPTFNKDANERYHDFAFDCLECLALGEIGEDDIICEEIECGDGATQDGIVEQLSAEPCVSNCYTNEDCSKAWYTLSAFHDTCPEDTLTLSLTSEFHDIEEYCPPPCVPDFFILNITATCVAELDEIRLIEERGTTSFGTTDSLDVVAKLDPTGMPRALVQVFSEVLNLAPGAVGESHVDSEGHLEYYVDGEQISRLYCPHAWVPLTPGLHNITVTAHANDFSVYTHADGILSGHTSIVVPEGDDMFKNETEMEGHNHEGEQVWHTDTPPQVALTATPDSKSGYNFQVSLDGFEFAPESVSLEHEDGVGHIHYSIDGEDGGMILCDVFHLDLLAGEHTIGISLDANDHSPYVDAEGNPLGAETTVTF